MHPRPSFPASKRACFVKKQPRLPSGEDRNDPQILAEPWRWAVRRPGDHTGRKKNDFYGTKIETYKGPSAGEAGKARGAEQIAGACSKAFHIAYVRD